MSVKFWPSKDPGETLDFSVDFTDLLEAGETIANIDVTWTIPVGLTKVSSSVSGGTIAVVWISGGLDSTSYECMVVAKTSANRTFTRTCVLKVKKKIVKETK